MTKEEEGFLQRVNLYAENVMADIDPQKTLVSEQLGKLQPILREIASEEGLPVEDIFIRYMDLSSIAGAKREAEFQTDVLDFPNQGLRF